MTDLSALSMEELLAKFEASTHLFMRPDEREALSELARRAEELRLREQSQIPVIPDAVKERLDRAETRVAELERGLAELHDYECGCENPGNLETCIARPVEVFRHLSR